METPFVFFYFFFATFFGIYMISAGIAKKDEVLFTGGFLIFLGGVYSLYINWEKFFPGLIN